MQTTTEINRNEVEKQLVIQVQVAEPFVSQLVSSNEGFVQRIPIAYLATENVTGLPMTYVLAEDGCIPMGQTEPQKVVLVQELNAGATPMAPPVPPQAKRLDLDVSRNEQKEWCCYEHWSVKQEGVEKSERMEELSEEISTSDVESGDYEVATDEEKSGNITITRAQKGICCNKRSGMRGKKWKPKNQTKNSKKVLKKGKNGKDGSIEDRKERQNLFELTKLEDNVGQVAERLKVGCECVDSNCFDGLCPDDVFRHRLNIADLTKEEHDMYLMGVIMASIHNLEETCRRKERIRIRCCYAYQGKKVCLTAFLYLQHVSLYQMKRLRSHLKSHGVSPRIHGNRGRKPANTFSLDIYRSATEFVQSYIEKNCVKTIPNFTFFSKKISNFSGKEDQKEETVKIINQMTSYHLPPDCTKRLLHKEYKSFCENLKHCQKGMKYSTFTNFLKKQFPNVKFQKREEKKQTTEQRGRGRMEEAEGVVVKEEPGLTKCLRVAKVEAHSEETAGRSLEDFK